LETLADHDDELMEQLLEDVQPPRDKVFDDLSKELREGLVCPVLFGSATRTNGVLRLMKALRHESPGVADTAKRLGGEGGHPGAYLPKTINTPQGGRTSVARVLSGNVGDGTTLLRSDGEGGRVAAVFKLMGQQSEKRGAAEAGDTVALGKLDHAKTGDTLSDSQQTHPPLAKVSPHAPVLSIAVAAKERKDDVKLGQALAKLLEEDPSISVVHNAEAHEVVICGCAWPPSGWPTASASPPCRTTPRSAIARPSRRASCSAAATRSSRAATANTATSCSTSNRCRAARASASARRSRAAWCRAITFPRWRQASSARSST